MNADKNTAASSPQQVSGCQRNGDGVSVATVLGIKGRRLEKKDFMAADERG
jgi:hypothetical protein